MTPKPKTLCEVFGYLTEKPKVISWMFWRGCGPSGRWSLDHLTADGKRTLCGLRIPDAFDYKHENYGDACQRCERSRKETPKK